ncbi:hypothetical protein V8J88_16015 [Massilia sp. W12]|uniref:hypothetical protein n=1 Tax=Massilia sp. W12 TaxID=3126507 RepID=UPI0030CBB278
MKQSLLRLCLPAALSLAFALPAQAAVQSFTNDYAAWAAAAGAVSTVDFETLPNGAASTAGTQITSSFNYDSQQVHFSSNANYFGINGNPQTGFGLAGSEWFSNKQVYIRADLIGSRHAFGLYFPGNTTLSVYDAQNNLLASNSFSSSGSYFFMGFVSDTPIAYAVSTRGYDMEYWQSVAFSSTAAVPEAESWAMMGAGLLLLAGLAKRNKA